MAEAFTPSSFDDHQEELDFLKQLGFVTNPLNKQVSTIEEGWEYAQEIKDKRETLPYNIDGVVIKLRDNVLASHLQVVGKAARAWAAIKFPPTEVITRAINLVWQVGRTGRLTPVVELEPVVLDGTTVKRATFHNYKEVVEVDLHTHDSVILRKAGDIIPEVVQVLPNLRVKNASTLLIPTRCPSCGTQLITSETGVDLICPNSETCKEQIVGRLTYFTSRGIANIQGLSEKTIEKCIELFGIRDVCDLFDLPYDQLFDVEGFGKKSVDKLRESVATSSTLPDYKFLAGLGIEGVGPEVAKMICRAVVEKNK